MTTNDTYEAGLIAAMNALDALSETYLAEARAYGLIAGMVSDYRYRKASA